MNQTSNYQFHVERLQQKVLSMVKSGANIRKFSVKLGLNNSSFSKELGVDPVRWKNPKADTLVKLSSFFGVPVEYFFCEDKHLDKVSALYEEDDTMSFEQLLAGKNELISTQRRALDAQEIAIRELQQKVDALQKRLAETPQDACITEQTKTA